MRQECFIIFISLYFIIFHSFTPSLLAFLFQLILLALSLLILIHLFFSLFLFPQYFIIFSHFTILVQLSIELFPLFKPAKVALIPLLPCFIQLSIPLPLLYPSLPPLFLFTILLLYRLYFH